MSETLSSALIQSLAQNAARPLLEAAGGVALTYREVDTRADQFAGALQKAGITPGERILVQIDKSPDALALYLACLKAGAIYLPLNSDYTDAELAYFIGDAEPRLAVCAPAAETRFRSLVAERPGTTLHTLGTNGDGSLPGAMERPSPPPAAAPDDTAVILYTSGTTGRPKGAMLSQRNLVSNARTLIDVWRFSRDDSLIHALPLFHAHGLFVAAHCSLLSGARMTFLPRFDVDAVVGALPHASVFMGVPTHYTRLLAHPAFTRESAAGMRLFVSGSAPLTDETFNAFAERTGKHILERYGMTETAMLTSNPYDGERRAGTVGPALPGVSVRVVDRETGRPLPEGETGAVEVKGPNVFSGYWRNPEKTAASFTGDGYFRTGDLGFIDSDRYVHLVGRGTDLIISGGLNVYPKEVEDAIEVLPGVADVAVVGVPHPDFGEAVVAVIVATDDGLVTDDAVRTALRSVLAGFKIPKRVEVVPELPRNTMGKVQKTLLRTRYKNLFAGS